MNGIRWIRPRMLFPTLALAAAADASFAQLATMGVDRSQNASCTSAIAASSLVPVVLYAALDPAGDTASLRARPAAQVLTGQVAHHIRQSFGGRDAELGHAEPRLHWRAAYGWLRVTAHRDGRLTWAPPPTDSILGGGVRLLASGFAAVHEAGTRLVWPPLVLQDSVSFTVRLHTPTYARSGGVKPLSLEQPEPLVIVRQPWIEDAEMVTRGGPRFPGVAQSAGGSTRVTIAMDVDTAGRVDMATARDLEPPSESRFQGVEGRAYTAALKSVMEYLGKARFEPARIGPCPVRQTTIMAFEFVVP